MKPAILIAAALSLALAGCEGARNERVEGRGAAGLCKPFPRDMASTAPGADPAIAMDDCLHRWGYALARANDPAAAVAGAVVAACAAPLSRWNQQTLGAPGQGPPEAPSLLTGEPTNPIAAHAAFAESRALFYVVQARAGKCEPPRIETGDRTASSGL